MGFPMRKIPKAWHNVTQNEYLYGDFDQDSVPNVDDTAPFDKTRGKPPEFKKDPEYYGQARISDNTVLLSDELKRVHDYNQARVPFMQSLAKRYHTKNARIKTVASTIKKMNDRYLMKGEIKDIAGIGLWGFRKRVGAEKMRDKIVRREMTDPNEYDDYYAKPKDKVYRAFHVSVLDKNNWQKGKSQKRVEVQLSSKGMHKFNTGIHERYKKEKFTNGWDPETVEESLRRFNRGE